MPALLDLPKELRLQIWDYVLDLELGNNAVQHLCDNSFKLPPNTKGPLIIGKPPSWPWTCRPDHFHPALLETSSLVRSEAIPLLYGTRTIILFLRFCESRAQIDHWIEKVATYPAIYKHIRNISIQFFGLPHRCTATMLDCRAYTVTNKCCWTQPLTGKKLAMLQTVENILARFRCGCVRPQHNLAGCLKELVAAMILPVSNSKLKSETIANLRLHGPSDFQLRFEVVRRLCVA